MRETIKAVVEAGGIVQFHLKRGFKDWIGEVKIGKHKLRRLEPTIYWVMWPYGHERYETLDEALDFFMKTVFTRKNLALAYDGIRNRGMAPTDHFDDLKEEELKALVKKYNDEFFAEDYPFVGKT